jgi:peptidoglycan-associated lipoprotein
MRRWTLALLAALSMMALVSGCCSTPVKTAEPVVVPPPPVVKAAPAPVVEPAPAPAPAPAPVVEAPKQVEAAPAPAPAPAKVALAPIYFNYDKSDLSQNARNTLSQNANALKSSPNTNVSIEGHCDERGSAEYNLALGERRAKAAQQYLVTLGVQPDRLSTVSYGEEKPAAAGHNEAAWAKNRRVEFVPAR